MVLGHVDITRRVMLEWTLMLLGESIRTMVLRVDSSRPIWTSA